MEPLLHSGSTLQEFTTIFESFVDRRSSFQFSTPMKDTHILNILTHDLVNTCTVDWLDMKIFSLRRFCQQFSRQVVCNLQAHQKSTRGLVVSHPCSQQFFFVILALLLSAWRYLIVISICIFPKTNEVELLFIHLLAIWISFFFACKALIQVFCPARNILE